MFDFKKLLLKTFKFKLNKMFNINMQTYVKYNI